MKESWPRRFLLYNCFEEEDTLQRTVGGVAEVLLAENSILISVGIILSSTNKCCLWARTLRIVLTPVRLCDDSVTVFSSHLSSRRDIFESCLSDLLWYWCSQDLFGQNDYFHHKRRTTPLPKETLFYLQFRSSPLCRLASRKQLPWCLYGIYG